MRNEIVAVSTTTAVYPCPDCQPVDNRITVTPTYLLYYLGASAHAPI
jgi:hypothetical protein